jgi:surface antigen
MKYNLISLFIVSLHLSGCSQNISNLELIGATAGGVAGGYVGSQFGQGVGRMTYTASGLFMGGSAGRLGTRFLEKSDIAIYFKTLTEGLSKAPNGTRLNWKNPQTGSLGAFRPMATYRLANGNLCRAFRTTIAFSDSIQTGDGTACQQSGGEWKVVSDDFS